MGDGGRPDPVEAAGAEGPGSEAAAEPGAAKRPRTEGSAGEPEGPAAAEPGAVAPADDAAAKDAPDGGGPKRVKRKMALVFGFVGQAYRGLQINYEVEKDSKKKSVEEVMRQALVRAGAVTPVNAERLEQKIGWTRSSRTDQGVSAARIVVSAKFLIVEDGLSGSGHSAGLIAEVNRELPEDIRCFSAVKVPNSFDAKRACSWREYEYLAPLQMVAGAEGGPDGPSAEELAKRLEAVMRKFEGCHSFHNFTRLKAADVAWKDEKEGGGKGKGKGKGNKGSKGKGKGKGKGKKRKFEEAEEPDGGPDGDSDACEDGGPGELDAQAEAPEVEPPRAEGGAEAGAAAKAGGPAPEPPWVEICARDAGTGAWRERPQQILKHTQSTIFLCSVEPTACGGFLRVRLRGKFFIYNQIRLMVGTAAAVVAGALPGEFLDLALLLRVEMHMPLAPPTGLFLRTAGFNEMDQRAGFCAMDSEQASACMLPAGGFSLVADGEAAAAAAAFSELVEARVKRQWLEGSELGDWRAKLAEVRVPSGPALEELRAKAAALAAQEAELRESQAAADRRRREERLASGGSFVGVMPRRFAADMMVHFRLLPGWRVSNLQHALAARLRRWEDKPGERPEGLSSPPATEELLRYIASAGIEALSEEGAEGWH